MSPLLAFALITWAAIVLLFLGLAAVLREVRLLRVATARSGEGFASAEPDIVLGGPLADGTRSRIVLAADSGCPLCRLAAARLAVLAPGSVLLTHETAEAWERYAGQLEIVSDRTVWREVSHLSPPVLMLADRSGRVRRMTLPVRADEIDPLLTGWHRLIEEENGDAVDVRAHS